MRVASRTVFDFVRQNGATAPVETELLYQADDPFAAETIAPIACRQYR